MYLEKLMASAEIKRTPDADRDIEILPAGILSWCDVPLCIDREKWDAIYVECRATEPDIEPVFSSILLGENKEFLRQFAGNEPVRERYAELRSAMEELETPDIPTSIDTGNGDEQDSTAVSPNIADGGDAGPRSLSDMLGDIFHGDTEEPRDVDVPLGSDPLFGGAFAAMAAQDDMSEVFNSGEAAEAPAEVFAPPADEPQGEEPPTPIGAGQFEELLAPAESEQSESNEQSAQVDEPRPEESEEQNVSAESEQSEEQNVPDECEQSPAEEPSTPSESEQSEEQSSAEEAPQADVEAHSPVSYAVAREIESIIANVRANNEIDCTGLESDEVAPCVSAFARVWQGYLGVLRTVSFTDVLAANGKTPEQFVEDVSAWLGATVDSSAIDDAVFMQVFLRSYIRALELIAAGDTEGALDIALYYSKFIYDEE